VLLVQGVVEGSRSVDIGESGPGGPGGDRVLFPSVLRELEEELADEFMDELPDLVEDEVAEAVAEGA